ncbi:MAG: hypothetical protein E7287_08825 [Lachnospiraceae bacterium]|nr:hypothetical protein [Lachnospiraceae bacterium]
MASRNLAENPYEKLANAIVLQAVSDYRAALKKVKKNPKNRDAIDGVLQIEKFFRSEWYQVLTSVDGEYLIDRFGKEVSETK